MNTEKTEPATLKRAGNDGGTLKRRRWNESEAHAEAAQKNKEVKKMENIIEKQEELKQEVMVAAQAEITVVDQVSYEAANDLIGRLQTIKKEVVARFADPKKKAAEAHRAVCELEKSFLAPVEEKIRLLKNSTTNWYAAEQRRIAAEEERKRKEAEELAALSAEAEAAGDSATAAEAVVEAAMAGATVTVMPKVKGTAMREVWKAVVVDVAQVPREYMIVNQSMLDKIAQATKGAVPIPGVKFEKGFINSTRAK